MQRKTPCTQNEVSASVVVRAIRWLCELVGSHILVCVAEGLAGVKGQISVGRDSGECQDEECDLEWEEQNGFNNTLVCIRGGYKWNGGEDWQVEGVTRLPSNSAGLLGRMDRTKEVRS